MAIIMKLLLLSSALIFCCVDFCQMKFLDQLRTMREQGTIVNTNTSPYYQYLDRELWDSTEYKQMRYLPNKGEFITEKIDVLRFKHDNKKTQYSRRKRSVSVFGTDQRLRIHKDIVEIYPFSAVVRLENGCTGTLIWHQHILTAAHCVHNHTHINPPLHKLRVGFLNRDGSFDWVSATAVYVPPYWIKNNLKKFFNHDYAVIKLEQPQQRRWLPFGAVKITKEQIIQFAGFPSDKRANEMWYSICPVVQSHKHVFVNHCDAAPGMSGSGVYIYAQNAVNQRTVVGVFSSHVEIEGQKLTNRFDVSANVATRLTERKVERICKWIGAGKNCHKLNEPLSSTSRRRYNHFPKHT
ncbi:serine protease 23-like [Clytia hemisphaerica]|uniref:Serine protease n=1 Tax=Clytia hemisphaerica TaxID=252671 RepID=A0A7M5WZC5_9CNID|eukprot:TCONS_00032736-protein